MDAAAPTPTSLSNSLGVIGPFVVPSESTSYPFGAGNTDEGVPAEEIADEGVVEAIDVVPGTVIVDDAGTVEEVAAVDPEVAACFVFVEQALSTATMLRMTKTKLAGRDPV